jgi:hypothetical protein
MLYLGIGNAGTQILNHFRHQLLYELKLDRPDVRMAVGDADINNSVIHHYLAEGLTENAPPRGVCHLPLDRFWSGGCGVYHIIGELLAEEAHRRNQIVGVLNDWVPVQHRARGLTLFISAGGGTGGGAGVEIARMINQWWGNPTTRIVVALPEQDHFALPPDATPERRRSVSGHDSFQCASAGRLLTKFLARPGTADLFLVSKWLFGGSAAPVCIYEGDCSR